MENSDTQVSATSAASQSPDEVEHDAQSAGVSNKPTDAASLQTREEASNQEDSGATKADPAQANIILEAQSESRDTQSAEAKAAGSNSTPPTQSYVPPVKRFSAVNINKKFLQKNQSSVAAGSTANSGSSSNKQTGAIARPAPQTAHLHSRLVTAKLTASPLSSSPGQGWTRPNSVTPPVPSPANASGPAKSSIPNIVPVGGHSPPHLAPGGKIIQPQVLKQKVDGPGRQAWRSVQSGAISSGLQTQNEFPTAAEAARSRNVRPGDLKATAELSEAQKQVLSETADAFRGVHLDPNAHHWDEMEEEDNDDFLGDVIEFGDGRQYTIHVSEGTANDVTAPEVESTNLDPSVPVSKTERFVDDFDRSWPKSREDQGTHKEESLHQGRAGHSDPSSSFPGPSPTSARDGSQSRLLFNERSNRMEPISGFASHVPPHGVQIHRNGQDRSGRYNSNRVERDVPPHSAFAGDRKPHESSMMSHGFDQRAREIRELKSEASTLYFHGEHDRKGRSGWSSSTHGRLPSPTRPSGSRETSASRSVVNGAPSIASSDDQSGRQRSLNRDHHLAPLPHSGHTRDKDRQLPYHSTGAPPVFPSGGLSVAADSHKTGHRILTGTLSEAVRTSDPDRPQPALPVQTHLDTVVPAVASSVPPTDVEALRKAYLAESADRAKKRRQQEEEERLKAQERARKKAAELEAKIAAAKTSEVSKDAHEPAVKPATSVSNAVPTTQAHTKPTEAEVLQVIEDAIGSADPSDAVKKSNLNDLRGKEATSPTSSFARAPRRDREHFSVNQGHGSIQPRRPPPTAFADQADSWRTRPKPPVLPVENSNNDISSEPGISVLPDVRAFELHPDESMEVVDFADMSRLVSEKAPQNSASEVSLVSSKPARPVASDFFKGAPPEMAEQESWRKPSAYSQRSYSAATDNGSTGPSHQALPANLPDSTYPTSVNDRIAEPEAIIQGYPKAPLSPTSTSAAHSYHPHASPGGPRFLRSPNASYREAPLSALDDTMSRIKGALDVMHSASDHGGKADNKDTDGSPNVHLPASSPSKTSKWLPPALRPPGAEGNRRRTERFESTHPEPPRSPAPDDTSFTVRLPRISRRIGPLTKKQIAQQKFFGPVRWEILSFDPPVEGMTKKSLSVNDVLFRKPQAPYKSRKYRVLLPKSVVSRRSPAGNEYQRVVTDKPTPRLSDDADLGQSKGEQTSWRLSSASARLESTDNSKNDTSATLSVTSRSPPPELTPTGKTGFPPVVSGAASKPKSPYKMLDVADVAFYRDGRKHNDGNPSVPTVTFTVGSELEDQAETSFLHNVTASSAETAKPQGVHMLESTTADTKLGSPPCPETVATHNAPSVDSERQSATTGQVLNQAGLGDRAFEHKNDPFLQGRPVTPASQKSPSVWGKSPSRAPDPEHLKAVWSQAPDSDSVPTVNSLKSIADDLPVVPFTLQEVKSESGTPPPAPPGPVAPPTRMSASEVTRAFQTVPSGPSNGIHSTGLRTNHSSVTSPMSSQRVLKPPPIGLPPVPAIPRPPYLGYPTSLNNHSPSPPTLVYSHVMSNGMAGSPAVSPYGQPMWMPVVQQGPQMLRPQPSSPYSPSLMPYPMPMPPTQNGMYPPPGNVPNPQDSPVMYPSAPPASQMMVSPVLSHASPVPPHMMYQGSPMVVHVQPAGGTPQSRPYPAGVVGMGRGTMPVQNPMDPRSHPPPGPPAAPASRFPVQNTGYTHVAPPSYVRPW